MFRLIREGRPGQRRAGLWEEWNSRFVRIKAWGLRASFFRLRPHGEIANFVTLPLQCYARPESV